MDTLQLAAGWVIVAFMTALGGIIVVKMMVGEKGGIDLSKLVSEENGDASLSRFQFLIFTFIIAMGLLLIILKNGNFPNIGSDVFGLLGISGGSYVAAKIAQKSSQKKPDDADPD
ncbi:MAG: hypothetical protein V7776_03295 [Halopseudomonas aestusnigri]